MTSPKKNDRAIALNALIALKEKQQTLSQLQSTLTPFAQNLCFGVCRHYFMLDAICEHLLDKPVKKAKVHFVLLLGLYQLKILEQKEYAVLNETVGLLKQPTLKWAKGLVNAILRRYCREKATIHETLKNTPAYQYAYPHWLLERIQSAWPEQFEAAIQASNQHPPMSLRVNAKQYSQSEYLQLLDKKQINARPLLHTKEGIILETPVEVNALPGFEQGAVSVQDGAAQLACGLLQLKPGLRVLDACAAPGGKTCHILEAEPSLKACIALDIDGKRLTKIQENLTRLHLQANLLKADAAQPETWWDNQAFDRILLDAPCSATGVIRRHPDIKLLRTPEEVQHIVRVQAKLLNALWPLLAPGGIFVYATCSILPEENETQVADFLKQHADCAVLPHDHPWGHKTPHGVQILPGDAQMDGFFYSVLQKQS